MARILCGTRIRNGMLSPGTGGALVSVPTLPDRVFVLTAGHVAVPRDASGQANLIYSVGDPAHSIGSLWTWSKLGVGVTVDAALIWVDPKMVGPTIAGLGLVPSATNTNLSQGDTLTFYATDGSGTVNTAKVADLNYSIDLEVAEWGGYASYFGQIRTAQMVSQPGDSGAMVFDANNNVVGMLVGGADGIGDIITPIDAILNHPQWKSPLQFVGKTIPAAAKPPVNFVSSGRSAPSGVPDGADLPPNPRIPMEVLRSAHKSELAYAVPASVTLAQWALESGWGKSVSGKWNYGGITARVKNAVFPYVPGIPLEPATLCWTHEDYQGARVKCQRWFKDFDSADAFFEAHAKLIGTSDRYASARAKLPDVNAFVDALGPVYATDKTYAAQIKSIMRTNALYAYNLPQDDNTRQA